MPDADRPAHLTNIQTTPDTFSSVYSLCATMLIQAKCFPCQEVTRGYLKFRQYDIQLSPNRPCEVDFGVTKDRTVWTIADGRPTMDGRFLCYNSKTCRLVVRKDHEIKDCSSLLACRLERSSTENSCAFRLVTEENGGSISYDADQNPCWVIFPSAPAQWNLECLSGELCYLSNAKFDKRICCDIFGNLRAVDNRTGAWEIWRMIEVGNGSVWINSWTHVKRVLCSNADGSVFTSETKCLEAEWVPVKVKNSGVVLRSVAHGRFLCLTASGKFVTLSEETFDESYCWKFEAANRNLFYLQFGKYRLATAKGNAIQSITTSNKQSTTWKIDFVDDEFVTLQHEQSKRFLTANHDSTLTTSVGPQMWTLTMTRTGAILRSLYGEVLCCDDIAGNIFLSRTEETAFLWSLIPCLPLFAPTGRQIWTMAGAGIAGVALMAAAPLAVTGVIGAMGFGAEGIAAGSMAASMMSAEAIAGGGAIAAGGTVATLQSIGAAGLGFVGTSAAMGGGALVGSAVVGSTGAIVFRGSNNNTTQVENPDDEEETFGNRPFAAWECWDE